MVHLRLEFTQADLPPMPEPAFWHREGFTAVILKSSDLTAIKDGKQQQDRITLILENAIQVNWTFYIGKGSRKNNFPWLGAETPVWQGARTAHTPRMERTSNAARRDGSTPKQGKLFLREP